MGDHALVVGSGAGGSAAALTLAEAGWDVTVLEKGPDRHGVLDGGPPAVANDEVTRDRHLLTPDPLAWPRTFRTDPLADEPIHVGSVDELPQVVGGGTTHWDAKVPRFWDLDFRKRSMLGPVEGADVRDWPFTYDELAPYYERAEALLGVAGELDAIPERTRRHAPRSGGFPLPPGPAQRASLLLAEGARTQGWEPFPFPMAMSRTPYQGRPACNDCSFCGGFGCPIDARGGALALLRGALATGRVEVVPQAHVVALDHDGRRVRGVRALGADGGAFDRTADLVVLAASSIESSRLALLSGLPDPSGWLGRGLMLHWFSAGFAVFLDERVQAHGGRSTTHCVDDLCDPDLPGAREAAREAGLPYLRGGVLELGGTQHPIGEAKNYARMLRMLRPERPFGRAFKQLMRASFLRERMAAVQMIGEDLTQPTNTVDLDPRVRDHHGLPVPRVTYRPHAHELAAQRAYLPAVEAMLRASGADIVGVAAETRSDAFPHAPNAVPAGFHLMGGLRLGDDPAWSVTDSFGRYRGLDGLVVADGSVFTTSGAHNPTLTIVATALRNATAWASGRG